jgi:hypothetical protein
VPLELEEGAMPLNTYSPKKPFKATIKSVKRIVGPKVCTSFPAPFLNPPGKRISLPCIRVVLVK